MMMSATTSKSVHSMLKLHHQGLSLHQMSLPWCSLLGPPGYLTASRWKWIEMTAANSQLFGDQFTLVW